ncbi:DUF427-domain-containing protein [Mycena rebaudengoi]|nr:DUF427-domain-containing protein [Mycena rebaudengoi]
MAPPFTESHIEDSPRRIRVLFGGKFVVDTVKAKLVWENKFYPIYFFPQSELPPEFIELASKHPDGDTYDLLVGTTKAVGAVTVYSDPTHQHLNGLLQDQLQLRAADAWFEEDEQIFIHPKDPYKRIDVLSSSRHIRVEVEGVEVANTRSAKLLYETALPIRSYIPKTDCRLDLLVPSNLTTGCPYKAIVWWYQNPNLESFYDEKVDVFVDGVKQTRPATK